MKEDYWTIAEAKKYTGKSEGKIRSVITALRAEYPNDEVIIKEPFKGGYKIWVLQSKLLDKLGIKIDTIKEANSEDDYVGALKDQIEYLKKQVEILQSEKGEDRKRLDFLVKILGEKVQEDMSIKKIKTH